MPQEENCQPVVERDDGLFCIGLGDDAAGPFSDASFCARRSKKWLAGIKIKGRAIYLGRFDDPKKAGAAYMAALNKYFGDFANEEMETRRASA